MNNNIDMFHERMDMMELTQTLSKGGRSKASLGASESSNSKEEYVRKPRQEQKGRVLDN